MHITGTIFERRMNGLRALLAHNSIDVAAIADRDAIYYYCGLYNCLHMEFGRPTVLIVPRDAACVLVTPSIELEMAQRLTAIPEIHAWQDGVGDEWRGPLCAAFKSSGPIIGVEAQSLPPVIRSAIESALPSAKITDITSLIAGMRRIKAPEEIALARHAGKVADAMMNAARETIAENIPEFEVALAAMNAGTREAARILEEHYRGSIMSPNVHFLQIMASGRNLPMTHHRASTRRIERGDPVFMCFCGMTSFHQFKLGFDRTFWLGEIRDPLESDLYQVAIESQAAALALVKPGVLAEEVHAAYADIIQSAGFEFPFRCGRSTGYSFLEAPQLAFGDRTPLEENMVLAVDGSVTSPGRFRAQVGDSLLVTADGYELLTHHPKALDHVVIH
jgi:Xaa-Pro dipeptidase